MTKTDIIRIVSNDIVTITRRHNRLTAVIDIEQPPIIHN